MGTQHRRWLTISCAVIAIAGLIGWYFATRPQPLREVYAVQAWPPMIQITTTKKVPIALKPISGGRLIEHPKSFTPRVFDTHGKVLWEFNEAGEFSNDCCLTGDGSIVVVTNHGNVYAYTPDYQFKWTYQAFINPQSRCSLAVAENGTVFVGCITDDLLALESDGSLRWRIDNPDYRPIPLCLPDGGVLIRGIEDNLIALAADGSERWRTKPDTGGSSTWLIPADPAKQEPAVIVSSSGYYTVITGWDLDGNKLWGRSIGGYPNDLFSSIHDGVAYLDISGSPSNKLIAVDRHGKLLWQRPTSLLHSPYCIMPNGNAIILKDMGIPQGMFDLLRLAAKDFVQQGNLVEMLVINPKGKVISSYGLPGRISQIPPIALPDGTVLVLDDSGVLYCYEIP